MKNSNWTRTFTLFLISSMLLACSENEVGTDSEKNETQKPRSQNVDIKVIYGEDDRKDLYEVNDERLLHLAKSTALLIDNYNIEANGDHYDIKASSFQSQFGLCDGEPFAEQDSAGFCSGFLVGRNTLVTAGHCIRRQSDCDNAKFIFDYAIQSEGQASPKKVKADQVYSCNRIIKSFVQSSGADYAVIELDRNVTGRTPLKYRSSGQVPDKASLVVIGHPSGIPTKIAAGANVRSQSNGYFVANLDTYGGNSGSAVFNQDTGYVEGILVRGERDFVFNGNCRVSNVCTNEGCRGEDVTRITEASPHIPNQREYREIVKLLYKYLGFKTQVESTSL